MQSFDDDDDDGETTTPHIYKYNYKKLSWQFTGIIIFNVPVYISS